MTRTVVLLALLLLPALPFAEAQEVRQFRREPIPGLALTPLDNTTLELPQGGSAVLGILARNNGSAPLRLQLAATAMSRPDAPPRVTFQVEPTDLTLEPGAEARVNVTVALAQDAPNGSTSRGMLMVTHRDGEQMSDLPLAVRAPGECASACDPPEEGGFFFTTGPGVTAGPGMVRREFAEGVSRADPNATRNASARALDAGYDETPGPGALLALGALGLVALALRRREE